MATKQIENLSYTIYCINPNKNLITNHFGISVMDSF